MADVFVSYKQEEAVLAQNVIPRARSGRLLAWWEDRIAPAEHFSSAYACAPISREQGRAADLNAEAAFSAI